MRILRFQSLGVGRLALGVFVIIAIITAIIVMLSCLFGVPILQALTAVGSVSTAVAIFFAILTLRDTQEWNRRQYTVELLDNWNDSTRKHFLALKKEFPEYFAVPDFITTPALMESWCLDKTKAKELAEVNSEHEVDLRGHIVALLNYFEGIALAYEQYVVDRDAIDDSVGTVILDFCVYFQPFIEEMRKNNRRDPWPPVSRTVELWLTKESRLTAQTQAKDASLRHVQALKKFESKLKKPTGI